MCSSLIHRDKATLSVRMLHNSSKKYHFMVDKRRVLSDGRTLPFGYLSSFAAGRMLWTHACALSTWCVCLYLMGKFVMDCPPGLPPDINGESMSADYVYIGGRRYVMTAVETMAMAAAEEATTAESRPTAAAILREP